MQKSSSLPATPAKCANWPRCWKILVSIIVAQTELGVDSAEETGLTFIENAILKAATRRRSPACRPSLTIPVWPSMLLAARRVFTPHAIPASTPATSRILRSCSTR
ncbi:Nucleoside 5-triphosphatase RdgB [Klebsiella pneumoniae]|uniref:Nucleoside 5-triphosphatase RdgB n=1 Tax=Klebsiella pneumoniae TaxID=573 RepID=A0A2X1QJL0_KLEPN|nr:Nucleoside 5-triphosphatase RdgB [Klebsiella pneumoniae]